MLIIGLTGGIGSGKSTVVELFADLGAHYVDADQVAREVVEPGEPALDQIAAHFGAEVLLASGHLDRAKLRQRVFAEPDQRRWLEALLHPLIRARLQQQLQGGQSPYALLVSPLLLETDQHQLVEKVVVVDLPEETQLQRATRRDQNSEAQIKAIMAAQMTRAERLDRADYIVDNSGSLDEEGQAGKLSAQVEALHHTFCRLASEG